MMVLRREFDVTCLFHLQDKVDVGPGELRALRVARELERIRGYGLCLFFQIRDQQVNCIASYDLCANALHEIAHW